jgi:hypothetical protein
MTNFLFLNKIFGNKMLQNEGIYSLGGGVFFLSSMSIISILSLYIFISKGDERVLFIPLHNN